MSDETEYAAKILPDTPATKDGFGGQGHERCARALTSAIRQMADRDGAIGLEGEFGAGKSTVIGFAERDLNANGDSQRNHHLFCFDLWTHRGDVFKRSFLEELLQWSENKKLLKSNQLQAFRDRIRDRTKTVTYDVDRRHSFLGGLLILMAPMIPVIVTWLGPFGFAEAVTDKFPSLFGLTYPQLIALGVTLILYLVIFGQIILKRMFGSKPTWASAYSSTVSVFRSETENRTEVQNIRDEDPTSLEFQRLFRDVVRLIQKDGARLVIVFDNIDRLPANQVMEVWAETRSVFATPDPKGPSAESAITAIMSYDQTLISQALSPSKSVQNQISEPIGSGVETPVGMDGSSNQAHELISKTFDITVRVSPPVSVDWRDHFSNLVSEAFGEHVSSDELWTLFKLLETDRDLAGSFPTPRQIRSFVNDIGSLWTQWQNDIPIVSIGLFILVKDQIVRHPGALRSSLGVPDQLVQIANQPLWRQHLAALLYNVEVEKASQVLLGPQIRTALTNEDAHALKDLAATEIFEDTLANVVFGLSQNLNSGGAPETLSSVSASLASLDLQPAVSRYCWGLLTPTVKFLTEPSDIEKLVETYGSLSHLVSNSPKEDALEVATDIMAWVTKSLPAEPERTREQGQGWGRYLDHIVSSVPDRSLVSDNRSFWFRNRVSSGAKFSLGVAASCAHASTADLSKLRFREQAKSLTEGMKLLCTNHPADVAAIATGQPSFLSASAADDCAKLLIEHLKSIAFAEATHPSAIIALASLSLVPDAMPLITKSLKAVEGDGTLLWHLGENLKSKRARSAAACFFVYTLESGAPSVADAYQNHPIHGDMSQPIATVQAFLANESPDEEVLAELESWIVKSQAFSAWLTYALDENPPTIVLAVVKKMITAISPNRLYLPDAFQKYDSVIKAIGSDYTEAYLRFLANWRAFVEETFEGEKAKKLPVNLIRDIGKFEIEDLEIVTDTVDAYFKELEKEDLVTLLQEIDAGASLLKHRLDESTFSLPAANVRPALVEIAILTVTGEVRPSDWFGLLESAYQSLSDPTQKKLRDTVFTRLVGAPETRDGVVHLFDCMPSLARSLPFIGTPGVALDKVFLHLIEVRTPQADSILSDLSASIKTCIKTAPDDAVGRIDEALQEEREASEEGVTVAQLREAIGLPTRQNQTLQR